MITFQRLSARAYITLETESIVQLLIGLAKFGNYIKATVGVVCTGKRVSQPIRQSSTGIVFIRRTDCTCTYLAYKVRRDFRTIRGMIIKDRDVTSLKRRACAACKATICQTVSGNLARHQFTRPWWVYVRSAVVSMEGSKSGCIMCKSNSLCWWRYSHPSTPRLPVEMAP